MRLLFLGDVVGRSGRDAVSERLPGLIRDYKFDFVIVNGENASHGKGLTAPHFNDLRAAGASERDLRPPGKGPYPPPRPVVGNWPD